MDLQQLQKVVTAILDMNSWEPTAMSVTLSATWGAEVVLTIPGLAVSSVDVDTMVYIAAADGLVISYWAVGGTSLTICFDKENES